MPEPNAPTHVLTPQRTPRGHGRRRSTAPAGPWATSPATRARVRAASRAPVGIPASRARDSRSTGRGQAAARRRWTAAGSTDGSPRAPPPSPRSVPSARSVSLVRGRRLAAEYVEQVLRTRAGDGALDQQPVRGGRPGGADVAGHGHDGRAPLPRLRRGDQRSGPRPALDHHDDVGQPRDEPVAGPHARGAGRARGQAFGQHRPAGVQHTREQPTGGGVGPRVGHVVTAAQHHAGSSRWRRRPRRGPPRRCRPPRRRPRAPPPPRPPRPARPPRRARSRSPHAPRRWRPPDQRRAAPRPPAPPGTAGGPPPWRRGPGTPGRRAVPRGRRARPRSSRPGRRRDRRRGEDAPRPAGPPRRGVPRPAPGPRAVGSAPRRRAAPRPRRRAGPDRSPAR